MVGDFLNSFISLPCVSILFPSNNSVQISVKRSASSKIQYLPGQTQNQYPPDVKQLPVTLAHAHALQLSSVITKLKQWQKKNFLWLC